MIPASSQYLAVVTTYGDTETKAELLAAYTSSGYTLAQNYQMDKTINGYIFRKDVMVFKKSDATDPTVEKIAELVKGLGFIPLER